MPSIANTEIIAACFIVHLRCGLRVAVEPTRTATVSAADHPPSCRTTVMKTPPLALRCCVHQVLSPRPVAAVAAMAAMTAVAPVAAMAAVRAVRRVRHVLRQQHLLAVGLCAEGLGRL